jgi:hypothetical protein
MSDNKVINFPSKKIEDLKILEEEDIQNSAYEFASNILDYIHDGIHEETGECIYSDDGYIPLGIYITEVLSSIYLMSQGVDHPFQEIAEEVFGADSDNSIDNEDETE